MRNEVSESHLTSLTSETAPLLKIGGVGCSTVGFFGRVSSLSSFRSLQSSDPVSVSFRGMENGNSGAVFVIPNNIWLYNINLTKYLLYRNSDVK